MAQHVYSVRFIAATITSTLTTYYTVPAGSVAIIKDMNWAYNNPTRAASLLSVLLTNTNSRFWYVNMQSGGQFSERWTGYQVLNAGEGIRASVNGAGSGYLMVTGYLFSVP